ncbi:MAG: PQQ-dependent sugar dehydrogenase [Phycisphaerales bacterium]
MKQTAGARGRSHDAARHAPAWWALIAGAIGSACASAQVPVAVEHVAAINELVYVTTAPGDAARLFALERAGIVRIIKDGTRLATPFLHIENIVNGGSVEQGLLGLAFDPGYAANGRFYVCYTGPNAANDVQIVRYRVSTNPDVADPGSAVLVLTVPHEPWSNHNAGWMAFGPGDGHLYIATGDGGDGCDPNQAAQNPDSLLGKILRINVAALPYTIPPNNPFASGGGRAEVVALGLRNPWRCGFDRETGDLWIGDVGEGAAEEINLIPGTVLAGPQAAPVNFGWDCREGFECATVGPWPCPVTHCPTGCSSPAFADPIHAYAHDLGCAVTGGYVYRGCAMPELRGTYFFADFCSGRSWSFRYPNGAITQFTERTAEFTLPGGPPINNVSSFGEDNEGELYVCDFGGNIFKIVPAQSPPDCNENGRPDGCDIAGGFSPDINGNGIPDECEEICYPDCNSSGSLTVADFGCFQSKYALNHPYADCNTSGSLSIADFGCFQSKFVLGCP